MLLPRTYTSRDLFLREVQTSPVIRRARARPGEFFPQRGQCVDGAEAAVGVAGLDTERSRGE